MRNIIYLGSLLVVLVFAISCDEEEWEAADIEKVPVYAITDIQGKSAPHAIDVYRNNDFMIEFKNANVAVFYDIASYLDHSTDTTYQFTYSMQRPALTTLGADTLITNLYEIKGTKKALNIGTLKIGEVVSLTDTIFTEHAIKINTSERYK
ncbi:hypothetical protein [Labilibaculum antarcticum]|uniref:Uncharacterized protein n=1 Tax=Labilibaculum antarcticum TaxID=1717717 RepID=A0A1Y1CL26_9BACT|nr:hypothetical protein [Labilibaculum antarcticum]BAX81109.1 hypothetical protein ALGA_2797 [Labilibaculum antarcticum]